MEKDNMRLFHDAKGVSKLILILLLLVSFSVGALLSYVWSLGYYGPWEYQLPNKSNVTIENVEFNVEDATYFNVTILTPSYSPSNVKIEQLLISTLSGTLISAETTVPSLPYELSPGSSQLFKVYLNWGNNTGQTVKVIVLVSDGSGATSQVKAPAIGTTITSVDFYPELTVGSFNITVASSQSATPVDITNGTVNGGEIFDVVSPALPYRLAPDTSVTFKVEYDWVTLQGSAIDIELGTLQGYGFYRTVTAPSIVLNITSVVLNVLDTSHFNVTVHNDASSSVKFDLNQTFIIDPTGERVDITEVSPTLPQALQPGSDVLLTCSWDWSTYQGSNTIFRVVISTEQDFSVYKDVTIP